MRGQNTDIRTAPSPQNLLHRAPMQEDKGTSSTGGLGREGFLNTEQVSVSKLFSKRGQKVNILGFTLPGLNFNCSALCVRQYVNNGCGYVPIKVYLQKQAAEVQQPLLPNLCR